MYNILYFYKNEQVKKNVFLVCYTCMSYYVYSSLFVGPAVNKMYNLLQENILCLQYKNIVIYMNHVVLIFHFHSSVLSMVHIKEWI